MYGEVNSKGRTWQLSAGLLAVLGMAATSSLAASEWQEEWLNVPRVDGSELEFLVTRPKGADRVPILVVIDGSGCGSATRPMIRGLGLNHPRLQGEYARVIVEKSGVARGADAGGECTDEFRSYYSADQRIFDHLRVLQHLRRRADWWDGRLYIWGWSEGAVIGAHLAAYTPETVRSVLGGLGGGDSMADQFIAEYCGSAEEQGTVECLLMYERLDDIRRNPTTRRTWLGDDNSWRAWASRLDGVESNILFDVQSPFLLIHGELSSEIDSARLLEDQLQEPGGPEFEVWEIPDMGHGFSELPEARTDRIWRATLSWLFGEPLGAGGPPSFGAD